MVVIVDIDCTLYSYAEFVKSQGLKPLLFYKAITDVYSKPVFKAVDQTWKKNEENIVERINLITSELSDFKLHFYTSFPITKTKLKTFNTLNLKVFSTYPNSKLKLEHIKKIPTPVSLVIGDRSEDVFLGKIMSAPWVGYRAFHKEHLLDGKAYTRAFENLILSAKERIHEKR